MICRNKRNKCECATGARIARCPPINGHVSHWYDGLPAYRPALPGDRDADVCIVGAGYTGLWTAYYLKRADPSLRIAVLEARFAGFGASGRNGGWLSGLVPGDRNRMAQQHGRDGVVAWQRALNESVDEVIDVAAREGIDAGIVKGGTLRIARNAAQASRLAAEVDEELSWKVDGIARADESRSGRTDPARRRGGGLPQSALRPHPARPPGARAGRRRGAPRRRHLRAVAGHRDHRRPGDARRTAPSPRRSCCGRPRGSPPRCPDCAAAGCR